VQSKPVWLDQMRASRGRDVPGLLSKAVNSHAVRGNYSGRPLGLTIAILLLLYPPILFVTSRLEERPILVSPAGFVES
jgi:hypothetical protein